MNFVSCKVARRNLVALAVLVLGCKSGMNPSGSATASPANSLLLENGSSGSFGGYGIAGPGANSYLLKSFRFPREPELLREHNIVDNEEYETSVDELTRWIERKLSSKEREKISEKCAALYGDSLTGPLPATHNLACLPWKIEQQVSTKISKRSKSTRSKRAPDVRNESDWKSLADSQFMDSFYRIDPGNLNELEKFVTYAQSTAQDCKFGQSVAAIWARAEAFLPEQRALTALNELYPIATKCLKPEDDGYERTHLRMGLMAMAQGNKVLAKESLNRAMLTPDPDEEFRSLFWLGVIHKDTTTESSKANEHWNKLIASYPISFHAVLAAHSLGLDPLAQISPAVETKISRRTGNEWNDFDVVAFVFELLIARREAVALQKWSQFVARVFDAPLSPENTLYLAHCHQVADNYRSSFSLLSSYMRNNRDKGVSLELLDMIFPRPFADEIIAHSSVIDPLVVFALIRQESAFDPLARSVANARGLMQVLPTTARRIKPVQPHHLYDPTTNIDIGTSYLSELLKKNNGSVEHALASYNAGGRNLEKWKVRYPDTNTLLFSDLIPFRETRTYVSIILRNAYWYGRLMVKNNDALSKSVMRKSSQASFRSSTVSNLLNVAWAKTSDYSTAAITELYMPSKPGAEGSVHDSKKAVDSESLPTEATFEEPEEEESEL